MPKIWVLTINTFTDDYKDRGGGGDPDVWVSQDCDKLYDIIRDFVNDQIVEQDCFSLGSRHYEIAKPFLKMHEKHFYFDAGVENNLFRKTAPRKLIDKFSEFIRGGEFISERWSYEISCFEGSEDVAYSWSEGKKPSGESDPESGEPWDDSDEEGHAEAKAREQERWKSRQAWYHYYLKETLDRTKESSGEESSEGSEKGSSYDSEEESSEEEPPRKKQNSD